jgi:CHAD domain-containing protein
VPYRLDPARPVADEIRRIAVERIEHALAQLRRGGEGRHEGVHEARKDFKKLRALFRLVRPVLGGDHDRWDRTARDLGRRLSEARDREAARVAFATLVRAEAGADALPEVDRFGRHLARRADEAGGGGADSAESAAGVPAALERLREEVRERRLPDPGHALVEAGLRRGYRRARRRFARARGEGTDEAYHAWRKRVKDHGYHCRLLRSVWMEEDGTRRHRLDALAEVLGDHQDLVLLDGILGQGPAGLTPDEIGRLAELVDRRRRRLRSRAHALGSELFAPRPRALGRAVRRSFAAAAGRT